MTISFNSIPISLRTPGQYIEFDGSKAVSGLPQAPAAALIIGQRRVSGTVPANTPLRVVSLDHAIQAFGRGSTTAAMVKAFRRADPYTELWAIATADGGGSVAAVQTITVSGPATGAGTIALMIAGQAVNLAVASGDTSDAIATALRLAINAVLDLPVTATVAASVVTVTASNKGTSGNDIDYRHSYYQGQKLPAGVDLAFAVSVAGTGDPDIASVIAAIGDRHFTSIVLGFPSAATWAVIEPELADRWGPMRMIEGMVYASVRGTVSGLATIGAARNSPYVSMIGARSVPNPPWEWAATYGAVVGFNAAIDPARPFQTLAMPGMLPPAEGARFTRSERELLLIDGISTFTVDPGGSVLIERAITTYQTNAFGIEDIAFLDVNTPLTLAYLRLAVRSRIALKFPRHKLASDDAIFGAGQAIVTPRIIRAELIALFRELEDAGLVEGLDQFVADLIVERDAGDPNRVNALIPPDIVNQFRVFAGRVEFRL